jgi:transposase
VLTERARAEACRRVGKDAHAVAAVARDLGVGWATVMRAVADHGRPLVDDPTRLEGVTALGLDETSFLKATRVAPTRWVTGLVDLEGGRLLEVVADRTRAAVHGWLDARSGDWLAQVGTVALDPWRGYASALRAPLSHARVVVDHFHAIRLANAVVDQVRRRTQQATLGHRGRRHDPLYRIRKLLLTAQEQLTSRGRARLRAGLAAGDPGGEVGAAWQGKELLRAVYAADGVLAARAALERFYRWSDGVGVAELSRLARTVRVWQVEILAFHATDGCSNGPTEAMNLLVKKVKRVGHGFRNFTNYRLRLLCTAASGGRRTEPQDCGDASHAWGRTAPIGRVGSADLWAWTDGRMALEFPTGRPRGVEAETKVPHHRDHHAEHRSQALLEPEGSGPDIGDDAGHDGVDDRHHRRRGDVPVQRWAAFPTGGRQDPRFVIMVAGDEVPFQLWSQLKVASPDAVHAPNPAMLVVVDRHQPEVGCQPKKQHDGQQHQRECGESGAQKRRLCHQGKRDHIR